MTARPLEPEGAAFIHGREACRLQAYDDYDGCPVTRDPASGRWMRPSFAKEFPGQEARRFVTIGWGQRVWGPKYYGPCTQAQADQWFLETVADHCAVVDRQCPDANKWERGAMVSVSYNCGTQGFIDTGIPALHNKVKSGEVSIDGLRAVWLKARIKSAGIVNHGLIIRRAREFAFYCTPGIDASTPGAIEFTPEEALNRAYLLAGELVAAFV